MALTRSKRWRNWVAVALATLPLDGIKRITFNRGVQDLQDSADNDSYITVATVILQNPSFTISMTDAYAALSLTAGVKGAFTATHCDNVNGALATGGAYIYTTNSLSYIGEDTIDGGYNELGTDAITVKTCSIDGTTNPVTVAAA